MKPKLTSLQTKLLSETGKLVLWYVPMILIGIFIGWLWAFIALTVLYLGSLTVLYAGVSKILEAIHAND